MVFFEMFVLALLGVVTYFIWTGFLKSYFHFYSLALKIPGPKAWPIIGCSEFWTADVEDYFDVSTSITKKYPSPTGVFTGPFFCAIIHKREDFEIIIKNPSVFSKTPLYCGVIDLAKEGLVTTNNEPMYKRNKRMLMKGMNNLDIKHVIEKNEKAASKLCKNIEDLLNIEVEITKKVSLPVWESNLELLLGVKTPDKEIEMLYDCVEESIDLVYTRASALLPISPALYYMTTTGRKLKQKINYFDNFFKKIVAEISDANNRENVDFDPLCNIWLDHGKEDSSFSLEELVIELKTFITASSDTTSATICYTLMVLGTHTDIQDKVIDELFTIFPDEHSSITPDDVKDLKYLECVVKETLRLLPIIGYMGRVAGEDIALKSVTIPKGTHIMFNLVQIHRDPKVWKNPLKFDPDRFLPEEFSKMPPYSYIPWSSGPRVCPGMQFSLLSIKTILATVLRRYSVRSSVKLASDIKMNGRFISKARGGNNVTFSRRR